jgi:hypothetical protein
MTLQSGPTHQIAIRTFRRMHCSFNEIIKAFTRKAYRTRAGLGLVASAGGLGTGGLGPGSTLVFDDTRATGEDYCGGPA